jgi:hypothetical protein
MLNAFGIEWEEPLQKIKDEVFNIDPLWTRKKETSGQYFSRKSKKGVYDFESEAAFYGDPPKLESIRVEIIKADGHPIDKIPRHAMRRFLLGLRKSFEEMAGRKGLVKWSLASIFKPFHPFFREQWELGRTEIELDVATNYSGGLHVSIWMRSRVHEMRYLEKYGEGEK